jgi:hypothetical protein
MDMGYVSNSSQSPLSWGLAHDSHLPAFDFRRISSNFADFTPCFSNMRGSPERLTFLCIFTLSGGVWDLSRRSRARQIARIRLNSPFAARRQIWGLFSRSPRRLAKQSDPLRSRLRRLTLSASQPRVAVESLDGEPSVPHNGALADVNQSAESQKASK